MTGTGAKSNGLATAARWRRASAEGMARNRCGSVIVLTKRPNIKRAVAISGAKTIERFCHSSRRMDQYIGRVGDKGTGERGPGERGAAWVCPSKAVWAAVSVC